MKHDTLEIAARVARRALAEIPLTNYTGILLLEGMARNAVASGQAAELEAVRRLLAPFVAGEKSFKCNFPNYLCGGNGTAYLLQAGHLPEAAGPVLRYAEEIMQTAPRDSNGILCHPNAPTAHRIWIDVAFAVGPFLLYAGLALDEERYIEEAYQQTAKMVAVFRDPANGLLHQSLNFRRPGLLSQDHWSRGNGWGLLALTELVQGLPADHPRRAESERLFTDLVTACLPYQDAQGMWHQEITDPEAYVETSGTGLILYALGVGLERGLIDAAQQTAFERGLRGYLRYIALDGSVHHTCPGCLCPGEGTIADYLAKGHRLNDGHAFGPVVLAFGQAARIGITEISA
ncbi:MAG: glycoside hydrolase family 88 protein [Candidatus Marinimicrobia bacterium]|nr:glycoside hydrolase family 88 protein [Candidatus Neomarinimicrobiota bacterium]